MKRFITYISIVFFSLQGFAQIITPEQAIAVALKNNFDILVAFNTAEIDRINNSLGNAGILPDISASASDNYYLKNSTNSLNANVGLSWTLFDGGKMFVTKKKLSEIEQLGQLQYKNQVEQTVNDVIIAYYNVVRQKQLLASINQVIVYNKERVKILETSLKAGLTAKNNLLQAKIDLNVFLGNSINQEYSIVEAKRTLNMVMARDSSVDFDVIDSIPVNFNFDKNNIVQKLDSVNTSILTYQKLYDISRLSMKEYYTNFLPRIEFNTSYNYVRTGNSASDDSRTGPVIGATISVPIFTGWNNVNKVRTSRIQMQSAKLDLENTRLNVRTQMHNAILEFENQHRLLDLETENASLAKENLELSMQRLRLGETTSLELRQAEESYEEALTRLLNFQFNLKVTETKLRQLLSDL